MKALLAKKAHAFAKLRYVYSTTWGSMMKLFNRLPGTMASERYQPEVHKATTREEIQKISDSLNLHCSPGMIDAITETTTKSLKSLDIIDKLADFLPEVKFPRTPGYKPAPEDNFGNAWAWHCDIAGAPSGKLHGKTFAIKDNCAVAGVPMANGSLMLEGYTPEYDATVVTKILDAGGRILGKAACDDFCMSTMGYSSPDGYIHFPDKPDRSAGGSSGGSAVLVASGQVDMAIGGDQGGSIRIPATYTGTVGLKPTHGLVPYTGLISVEPMVDHVGPITKTVTDCALLLEVIAGNDGLDARQPGLEKIPEYSKLLEVDITGKTLGILQEGFDICDDSTRYPVLRLLNKAETRKLLKTTTVSVPMHKHGVDILTTILLQGAVSSIAEDGSCPRHVKGFYSTSLEKAVRSGMQSSARLFAPGPQSMLVFGQLLKSRYGNHYYTKARNLGVVLSQKYDEALEQCDVLVMPTVTRTVKEFPCPKEDASAAETHKEYLGQSTDMNANTNVANVTGHPALSLPLGPLGDGFRTSIMIVGKKFDEVTVLQVARALEKWIKSESISY